ncbi:hypothetical protein ABKN59_009524 [Abortiporus biennis]
MMFSATFCYRLIIAFLAFHLASHASGIPVRQDSSSDIAIYRLEKRSEIRRPTLVVKRPGVSAPKPEPAQNKKSSPPRGDHPPGGPGWPDYPGSGY